MSLTPDQVLNIGDLVGEFASFPAFKPRQIALALYDGIETYLLFAPPVEGFEPLATALAVYRGRHPALVANTATRLGGVPVATVLVTAEMARDDLTPLAALCLHEQFHVFQAEQFPAWGANEVELFTYPTMNPINAALKRLELEALRRAWSAMDEGQARGWALNSQRIRAERFTWLSSNHTTYERELERLEGLAHYVEATCFFPRAQLLGVSFGPAEIRQTAYFTGHLIALLLDRFSPSWKRELVQKPDLYLDMLFATSLSSRPGVDMHFSDNERSIAFAAAERDVARSIEAQREEEAAFYNLPGWTLVLQSREPLFPAGFDPMNLTLLDDCRVLHRRYLNVQNPQCVLEVIGKLCLTLAAGEHPLFGGVRQVLIKGIVAQPKLEPAEFREDGLTLSLPISGTSVRHDVRTKTVVVDI